MTSLRWAGWLLALTALPVAALEAEWDGVDLQWKNLLSIGAQMRMQDRSDDFVGKLNVAGQQTLCASDGRWIPPAAISPSPT